MSAVTRRLLCPACRLRPFTRPFSTARPAERQTPRWPDRPPAASSSSSSSSSNWSSNNIRAQNSTRRAPVWKQYNQRPVLVRLRKLSDNEAARLVVVHLREHWLGERAGRAGSKRQPTTWLEEFSRDLGVDYVEVRELSRKYARGVVEAMEGGQQVPGWDLRALGDIYEQRGAECIRTCALASFVQWVGDQHDPSRSLGGVGSSSALLSSKTLQTLTQLARLTDVRYPHETSLAREMRRTIYLHVGPTNSGKTHAALQALSRARTGAYAGPLRLLAHEVYQRFKQGTIGDSGPRPCNLVTGEDVRIEDKDSKLQSCTVEMFPYDRVMDVCVVDEIQLLGDPQRGRAWTKALVDARCTELHLCGEESVIDLVQRIATSLGDTLIVKRYERLSPLKVAAESLKGGLKSIRPGDCVVTFSRSGIFALKRAIEARTGLRVAVAYGALPPEVRELQAKKFNAGEYDVLVGSDAIGMGLNLKIKRIIFDALHKWNSSLRSEEPLSAPQVKQIGGRAGRYGLHSLNGAGEGASEVLGEVTTIDARDMGILAASMKAPVQQLQRACIAPGDRVIELFMSTLPKRTPFHRALKLLFDLSATSSNYFAAAIGDSIAIAEALDGIHPLSVADRWVFTCCPISRRDPNGLALLQEWVAQFARGEIIDPEEWISRQEGMADLVAMEKESTEPRTVSSSDTDASLFEQLLGSSQPGQALRFERIESFHRSLTHYLWLYNRFHGTFTNRNVVVEWKARAEAQISSALSGRRFAPVPSSAKRRSLPMSSPPSSALAAAAVGV